MWLSCSNVLPKLFYSSTSSKFCIPNANSWSIKLPGASKCSFTSTFPNSITALKNRSFWSKTTCKWKWMLISSTNRKLLWCFKDLSILPQPRCPINHRAKIWQASKSLGWILGGGSSKSRCGSLIGIASTTSLKVIRRKSPSFVPLVSRTMLKKIQ